MDKALRGVLRSASGIAGSLVFAVAASKWMSVTGGPTGVGVFGQLKNLQQTFLGVGTLNGQAAFIQGMASRRSRERWAFASVAMRAMVATALILGIAGLLAAPWLARRLLGAADAASALGVSLTIAGSALYVVSTAAAFVLAAIGRLEKSARIQMAGSAGILAGVVLAVRPDTNPAAVGVAILLGGVTSCAMAYRALGRGHLRRLIAVSARRGRTPGALYTLRAFGTMAAGMALGGVVGALTRFALRALIVQREGLATAGLFEASWTISMTYMSLLLSSLGGYLLPALSMQRDAAGRSALLSEFLRVAVACGVPLICGLMLFRHEAVSLLYARGLAPAADLLAIMVAGDFFKLLGWVFAMPMLAAADARAFLVYESAFNAAFLGGVLLLSSQGWPVLEAVGGSFVACYMLYALATLLYCHWRGGLRLSRPAVKTVLGGAAVIAAVFVAGRSLNSMVLRAVLLTFALGASALALGADGRRAALRLVRREA